MRKTKPIAGLRPGDRGCTGCDTNWRVPLAWPNRLRWRSTGRVQYGGSGNAKDPDKEARSSLSNLRAGTDGGYLVNRRSLPHAFMLRLQLAMGSMGGRFLIGLGPEQVKTCVNLPWRLS